jgi:hypothetical protein
MIANANPTPTAVRHRSRQHLGAKVAMLLTIGVTFVWCLQRTLAFAWLSLSTSFALYDDEGYVLVSVREFLAGRPLYNEVFSQYGPFYYAYKHLLSLAQGLPTHDLTRVTTLYTWICAAALLGLAGLCLTRSGLAAVAVFCAASLALLPLVNEPGHPQELLVALTALSVAVAASPIRLSLRVPLLASITALACLTKANVGVFIGLATLTAVLPLEQDNRRVLFSLVLGALPALLMSSNLVTWAWPYALGCGASIVVAVAMRPNTGMRVSSFRTSAPIIAGLLLPIVLICLYVLIRRTTLVALLDGILLRPARMSNAIVVPLQVPLGSVAVSLLAAAIAMCASQEEWGLLERTRQIQPLLKVGVGVYVVLFGMRDAPEIIGGSGAIVLALLLPGSNEAGERFGRAFLALSAAFHTSTAYPVAGSQIGWSSFLLIVASYVCLWDGLAELRSAATEAPDLNRVIATGFLCLGLALHYDTLAPLATRESAFQNEVSLPFEGATSIRMGHSQVATYNWLTQNLKGHCSDFVTLPGYNSLYPWSGMRPPTGYNNGAWMILLTDKEQRKIVRRMRETGRPCAVYHPSGSMWTTQPLQGRPLVDYIMQLRPVTSHAGYEIRTSSELVPAWRFDYLEFGARSFSGTEAYPVPAEAAASPSLRLWFKGAGQGGTIVGAQSKTTPQLPTSGWCPIIYLGRDGRLRAELWNGMLTPITTANKIDDQQWHHVVLVQRQDTQQLYVDATFVGETRAAVQRDWATFMQLGNGFTELWPEGNGSWFPFKGELRDVVVALRPWDPDDVARDYLGSRIDGNRAQTVGR